MGVLAAEDGAVGANPVVSGKEVAGEGGGVSPEEHQGCIKEELVRVGVVSGAETSGALGKAGSGPGDDGPKDEVVVIG